MVVLVETLIVHDHLDYCFKFKEKEGKIWRGSYFLLLFMSDQMYLQVICNMKLFDSINENKNLLCGVVKFWNYEI